MMERKWLIVTVGLIAAFLIGVMVGGCCKVVVGFIFKIEGNNKWLTLIQNAAYPTRGNREKNPP